MTLVIENKRINNNEIDGLSTFALLNLWTSVVMMAMNNVRMAKFALEGDVAGIGKEVTWWEAVTYFQFWLGKDLNFCWIPLGVFPISLFNFLPCMITALVLYA